MPFNINSFKTNVSDFGVLPTNKFELYVSPPNLLINNEINNLGKGAAVRDTINMLKFRSESLNAPGIALRTANINRYGIGPEQKYPVNAQQFADMQISIISDRYGDIWQFWYNWIRAVWQFNGVEDGTATGKSSRFATYTAEFKDEYSTTMQLLIYDTFGKVQQTINLYEAYPTTLREIGFDWSDDDNLLRINVSISYKDYTLVGSTIKNNLMVNFQPSVSATATSKIIKP
jgi:hypothetical protein